MREERDWQTFVMRIVRFASHGYHWYARVDIPESKKSSASRVDAKICSKYPEVELGKDKRYQAKKAGKANYAYLRWDRWGILLRSRGEKSERDDDIWHEFKQVPYVFSVGEFFLELKIGPGGRSKYTCYLTKSSYRALKTLMREYFEDQRFDQLVKQYQALAELPAFSGLIRQADELWRVLKSWRLPRGYTIKKLRLKDLW